MKIDTSKYTKEEIIDLIKDLRIPLDHNPYMTDLSRKQFTDKIKQLGKLL